MAREREKWVDFCFLLLFWTYVYIEMLYTDATIYIYAKIEYLIREIIKKYFIYKEVIQNFQRCSAYFSVTNIQNNIWNRFVWQYL